MTRCNWHNSGIRREGGLWTSTYTYVPTQLEVTDSIPASDMMAEPIWMNCLIVTILLAGNICVPVWHSVTDTKMFVRQGTLLILALYYAWDDGL